MTIFTMDFSSDFGYVVLRPVCMNVSGFESIAENRSIFVSGHFSTSSKTTQGVSNGCQEYL